MDAILIAGPTASGKSGLALRLAEAHGGAVVNADSMQVYDALRILTARPGRADEARVSHRLYGHVPVEDAYSVGRWIDDMSATLAGLRAEGRMPVVVGGTGLYFDALTGGLSAIPAVPEAIRRRWRERLETDGPETLHDLLADRDPQTAARLKRRDGQRIARALEVLDATGHPIRHFQERTAQPLLDPGACRRILVMPERDALHGRIARRFEGMVAEGAVGEVEAFRARKMPAAAPARKAIGLREIEAHLDGAMTLEEAVAAAVAATRRYAKRQATWFRNRFDGGWEKVMEPESVNSTL